MNDETTCVLCGKDSGRVKQRVRIPLAATESVVEIDLPPLCGICVFHAMKEVIYKMERAHNARVGHAEVLCRAEVLTSKEKPELFEAARTR